MNSLLVLKLTLAPVLVALASLAGRRWGLRASGLLASIPMVAGPVFLFYALDQGPAFAAHAARSSVLSPIAFVAFCLAFAWCGRAAGVAAGLVAGWAAFMGASLALARVEAPVYLAAALSVLALWLGRLLLPREPEADGPAAAASKWDLPLRAVAAGTLVFTLSELADRIGPQLSGLLAGFPVANSVLAGFALGRRKGDGAVRFLNGSMRGSNGFVAFCALLGVGLEPWGLEGAFAAGLAASLSVVALFWKRE